MIAKLPMILTLSVYGAIINQNCDRRRFTMRVRNLVWASLFAVIASASATAGEASYSAADLIQFFKENDPATRGVCVGTDEQCADWERQQVKARNLSISFEKNSDRLDETAKAKLLEVSKMLKDSYFEGRVFTFDGFTDASGSDVYNLDLSTRRAKAVADFLIQQGAEPSRLESQGFGESKFASADPMDAANRRVEARLRVHK
jgi:outer membrane protein OmpA-like peptidoglycan-associated protein